MDVDVRLFVMSGREDEVSPVLRGALDAANIVVIGCAESKVGVACVLQYRKALNDFSPDVVHLHTPNTELLHFLTILGRRTHAKIARTIHSTKRPTKLTQRIAMRLNRVALEIACSNAVAYTRTGRGNQLRIVVPNGIRFEWSIADTQLRIEMRRHLGLELGKYIFVNIGRMGGGTVQTSPKAHNILIEAWKKANDLCPNIELHLLGDGELSRTLKAKVDATDNIFFHGVVARSEQWLLAADCFVLPSRYEGMPIAAIEAIGTGIPCIFSDIPALRELSPSRCTWVPVDDVALLCSAILSKLDDGENPPIEETVKFRDTHGIGRAANVYRESYIDVITTH